MKKPNAIQTSARIHRLFSSAARTFSGVIAIAVVATSLVASGSLAFADSPKAAPVPSPRATTGTFSKDAVTFEKVFVPRGFDSNDNVEFVGTGHFAHSCYRMSQPDITVDPTAHTIRVSASAYQFPGFCIQVVLPFEQTVEVGVVPPGHYQIIQGVDSKVLGQVDVQAASHGPQDDYLYAPISQAFFNQDHGVSQVYLTGNFPNTCMHMKEVKTTVASDTIVVQPIVEMQNTGACAATPVPFKSVVNVDNLKPGQYLLHVRSMNGHAVNDLVDVQ